MGKQQQVNRRRLRQKIGKRMEVINEERTEEGYLARIFSRRPCNRRRRISYSRSSSGCRGLDRSGVVDSGAYDLFVRMLGAKKGLTNQPEPLGKLAGRAPGQ